MARDGINTPQLPAPIGPFSHAVRAGGFVYLSGQTAQDPASGKLLEGDVTAQTEQVFANLETVLRALGLDFSDAVKCNVFLTDMAHFGAMNAVYASKFEAPYPARSTVAVAGLPLNARVEIELVARERYSSSR